MDTSEEERNKGKTVEVGRAHFTTDKKRFTLLDAPGHKNYVPNMIGGTAQADVGVLVISARKGEFETGFDRGGQTREHAMLAKTLGIKRLIVMVNKMDEQTVLWSEERFLAIQAKLSPFLKKWGYDLKKEVEYIPVSGYTGDNIVELVKPETAPWYKGPSFMGYLNDMPPMARDPDAPLRIPIMASYKDMGAICCLGKVESGRIRVGDTLNMSPNNIKVECTGMMIEDEEIDMAEPGENVCVKVKGIEEEDIHIGFVLSHQQNVPKKSVMFEGQIVVLDLLEHKPIMTAGYECVLHVHTAIVECSIKKMLSELDRKTGKSSTKPPRFLKHGSVATIRLTTSESVAVELFKDHAQMGRFTLRDEGVTIAIGKITRIAELKTAN